MAPPRSIASVNTAAAREARCSYGGRRLHACQGSGRQIGLKVSHCLRRSDAIPIDDVADNGQNYKVQNRFRSLRKLFHSPSQMKASALRMMEMRTKTEEQVPEMELGSTRAYYASDFERGLTCIHQSNEVVKLGRKR